MISRRDALKLSATGLIASSLELSASPRASAMLQNSGTGEGQDRGNMARTGEMPGSGPDRDVPVAVKWSTSLGTAARSTPAVVDGAVYMSAGDTQGAFIFSLNVTTGEEQWRLYTGKAVSASSPTVVDGVVYVGTAGNLDMRNQGSEDPSEPTILAIEATSGEVKWSRTTPERIDNSPAVVDGVVYFGCLYPDFFPVTDEPHFWALEAATGEELWSMARGCGVASPAILDGTIYRVNSSSSIMALATNTGEYLWSLGISELGSEIELEFTPAVNNGVVYVGTTRSDPSFKPALLALDAETGNELWRFTPAQEDIRLYTSPAVVKDAVYVSRMPGISQAAGVSAVDVASGEERWNFDIDAYLVSAPTVADGVVYVSAHGESTEATLYALDMASGQELWSISFGNEAVQSALLPTPSPVVVDGSVCVMTPTGGVYMISNV